MFDLRLALDGLTAHPARTPQTTPEELAESFTELARLGDAGVYLSAFSGMSEWERHPSGDELVQVVRGSTQLTLLVGGQRRELELAEGQLTIVPRGAWHRFTSEGVAILTVTPPPTDHFRGDGDPRD